MTNWEKLALGSIRTIHKYEFRRTLSVHVLVDPVNRLTLILLLLRTILIVDI